MLPEQLKFQETLEDRINKQANFNEDLLRQQASTQRQQFELPSQLREEFSAGAISDPFAQERIIATRRGLLGEQAGFLGGLLEQRGQRFGDIVNRASQTVGAELAAEQAARTAASQQNAYDEFAKKYLEEKEELIVDTGDVGGATGGTANERSALNSALGFIPRTSATFSSMYNDPDSLRKIGTGLGVTAGLSEENAKRLGSASRFASPISSMLSLFKR